MNMTSHSSRVLVADDDQSIRQLLCTIVKRERLEVDSVPDGLEAIERLKSREYSVILLDLMMPRGDGFDVIQYLKDNPPHQKPIVLVISAYADQKFKEVDPRIVAGVLRKPFEVADIGNLVSLCVKGFHEQVARTLSQSDDRSIRDIAARQKHLAEVLEHAQPQGNDHGAN